MIRSTASACSARVRRGPTSRKGVCPIDAGEHRDVITRLEIAGRIDGAIVSGPFERPSVADMQVIGGQYRLTRGANRADRRREGRDA